MLIFLFLVVIFLINPYALAKDELVFAIDIIRHGDRTTLKNIANSNKYFKEGNGELTAIGMQQEFKLGVQLRKYESYI